MYGDCDDNTQRIKTTGTLTAETFIVDGRTDAETLLRSHTLNIRTVGNSSGRNSSVHFTPTHYVSRHQELLSAFLTWSPSLRNQYQAASPYLPDGMTYANASTMQLILPVASNSEVGDQVLGARLRCTVNGQPVEFPQNDQAPSDGGHRYQNLSQSIPNPDGNGTSNVTMAFWQYQLMMPLSFPPTRSEAALNAAEHAGAWRCDLRYNGTTLRTISFTIGANGLPVQHPEQAAGLYLGPRTVLVDVIVPANSTADQRTAPAEVRAGGFYGRPWATEAMRTAAAAVPAIGTPHLDPNPDGASGGAAAASGGSTAPATAAGGRHGRAARGGRRGH